MANKQQTPEEKETKKKVADKVPVSGETVKTETGEDTPDQKAANEDSAGTETQSSASVDSKVAGEVTRQDTLMANTKYHATQPSEAENAELKAKGLQILSDYPNEQKVYMTVNGFGFFRYTDARNHAETLSDKTILTINRK